MSLWKGLEPASLLQHEMLAEDRSGSWAAVRHHKHNLPRHLGKLTIRLAINRNAEALHDAANLAK
jgi:hypothetical protein